MPWKSTTATAHCKPPSGLDRTEELEAPDLVLGADGRVRAHCPPERRVSDAPVLGPRVRPTLQRLTVRIGARPFGEVDGVRAIIRQEERRGEQAGGRMGIRLQRRHDRVHPVALGLGIRAQQGLAGALTFPNGAALVRATIPVERRGSAFGTVGLATGLAAASGPPLGGALVHLFGWSAIFWANVPVVVGALLLALRSLPRGQSRRHVGFA